MAGVRLIVVVDADSPWGLDASRKQLLALAAKRTKLACHVPLLTLAVASTRLAGTTATELDGVRHAIDLSG
jgi:hypothetical protein